MNFLTQMLGMYNASQQPKGNALTADVERAEQLQRLIDQGMTPEEAQNVLTRTQAVRANAARPLPPDRLQVRTPTAIIGVRG